MLNAQRTHLVQRAQAQARAARAQELARDLAQVARRDGVQLVAQAAAQFHRGRVYVIAD